MLFGRNKRGSNVWSGQIPFRIADLPPATRPTLRLTADRAQKFASLSLRSPHFAGETRDLARKRIPIYSAPTVLARPQPISLQVNRRDAITIPRGTGGRGDRVWTRNVSTIGTNVSGKKLFFVLTAASEAALRLRLCGKHVSA